MGESLDTLKDKTIFVTGASRGIGRAIAMRAARDGANVVIAAKTEKPHPKLPGTIHSVAEDIASEGGKALAVRVDVRDEDQVIDAMARAVERFGGIDALVNNASAIILTPVLETSMKRYDLMMDINVRGSFLCAQACLPYLLKSDNPHILMLSPPIDLDPRWFGGRIAYTVSKYGMSQLVIGLAEEFREAGVAVNALWPRTVIATSALLMLRGKVRPENCRSPDIVADAAHAILRRDSRTCTGNHFIDEDVLAEEGITDLEPYALAPGQPLQLDLFAGSPDQAR